MIDWAKVQAALTRAGYLCGAVDGRPGVRTWTALFGYAAARKADAVIAELGAAAAAILTGDPIAATAPRLAEFLAQISNETGGFICFEEDLRYSAATMLAQWPSHFTPAQARACVGKPIEIASRAYGGRMGNAPWPSIDGWTNRGRGCLQLTGLDAYRAYAKRTGLPLIEHPERAADPADSLTIAIAVWADNDVNDAIDDGDFAGARRITNVGNRYARNKKTGQLIAPIGLAEVARRRTRLLSILA